MLYSFSTGNNVPGIFNMGHPEKNFDTLTPSNVAEVIRTLRSDERNLIKRFINPSNMSLPAKEHVQKLTIPHVKEICAQEEPHQKDTKF